MKSKREYLWFNTDERVELINITDRVREILPVMRELTNLHTKVDTTDEHGYEHGHQKEELEVLSEGDGVSVQLPQFGF